MPHYQYSLFCSSYHTESIVNRTILSGPINIDKLNNLFFLKCLFFLKWPWHGYSVPSSTFPFFDFTNRSFSNHLFFLPLTSLARASRAAITVNNISVFIFKTFFALVISFTASGRFHLRCVNRAPVARE